MSNGISSNPRLPLHLILRTITFRIVADLTSDRVTCIPAVAIAQSNTFLARFTRHLLNTRRDVARDALREIQYYIDHVHPHSCGSKEDCGIVPKEFAVHEWHCVVRKGLYQQRLKTETAVLVTEGALLAIETRGWCESKVGKGEVASAERSSDKEDEDKEEAMDYAMEEGDALPARGRNEDTSMVD